MKTLFNVVLITLILTSCQSNSVNQSEILKFEIVKKQDISFLNTPRMVNRIVLKVDSLPSKQEMENTATYIWENGNKNWKDFTVFIYLPEMNTEQIAYGVGEYNENGLVDFHINEDALFDTKWEIKKTNEPVKQIPIAELKKYSIKIYATNEGKRKVKIIINTNFPDGTILLLSIDRKYYLKGDTAAYSEGIFDKDFSVEQGKIETIIDINDLNINDSKWYAREARSIKYSPDEFPPIAKISDNVIIDILYTPASPQPANVIKILGPRGEFVTGDGVEKLGGLTVLDFSKKLNIPFEK